MCSNVSLNGFLTPTIGGAKGGLGRPLPTPLLEPKSIISRVNFLMGDLGQLSWARILWNFEDWTAGCGVMSNFRKSHLIFKGHYIVSIFICFQVETIFLAKVVSECRPFFQVMNIFRTTVNTCEFSCDRTAAGQRERSKAGSEQICESDCIFLKGQIQIFAE